MADALISPVVGGAFWLASAGLIGYSCRKIAEEKDDSKTPLMGVAAAFVFAAQMINFSIPGTGSSGHLGGGLLLAALLGPHRAFVALSSVLVMQCLFFADGGLLALGCNIFNLAFFPAFVAYPFIFRRIVGSLHKSSPVKLAAGCICAAEAGLLMGALSVVVQTTLSGISELPFATFLMFMLPIHFAIGVVEGLATYGVLSYVLKTQPCILPEAMPAAPRRPLLAAFGVAAIVVGCFVSWFASSDPDGLEWSVSKAAGSESMQYSAGEKFHRLSERIQEKTAFLPDYSFISAKSEVETERAPAMERAGTSVSGISGCLLVLASAGMLGMILRKRREGAAGK